MTSDFDLRTLDAEPPTPSRVDVERAIAEGRRRRARRGAGYAGAATLTAIVVVGASVAAGGLFTDTRPDVQPDAGSTGVASAPPAYTIPGTPGWTAPSATAPTSCTLDRLPVPDDVPMALTSGADPTGRWIVGRSYPKAGSYQAVIWHDGTPTKVAMPGELEESLQDVNSTGTAVGWSFEGTAEDSGPVPYVYRDGEVSRLPGGERGQALAVNDIGAIAGDSGGAPVVWPSATEEPTRLPLPAGVSTGGATAIDEDGTVVGNVNDERPYVWFADGTHRELPLPTLDGAPASSGLVFSVRNGWATGLANTGSDTGVKGAEGTPTAVRWNVRTGEVRVFDELDVRASTANAQGWQVGSDKQGNAVLMTDAGKVVLPDLGTHGPLSVIPSTLSDDGRVISGQADDTTGTIKAVVWRCE
jgi:uncharacterized membrane protein